jgi:hypothetical protein
MRGWLQVGYLLARLGRGARGFPNPRRRIDLAIQFGRIINYGLGGRPGLRPGDRDDQSTTGCAVRGSRCVTMLALIAGKVSYLHVVVEWYGQPGWVAALTPFWVDGMIVAASTTLPAVSRSTQRPLRESPRRGRGPIPPSATQPSAGEDEPRRRV